MDRLTVAFLPQDFPDTINTITLPHPSTGLNSSFIVNGGKIYELQVIDRPHSSWLIDQYVLANGTSLFATEINPYFLALPLMAQRAKEKCMYKVDDFFLDTPLAQINDLLKPAILKFCKAASEVDGNAAYIYDEQLGMNWLVAKAEKLLPMLRKSNPIEDHLLIEIAWDIVCHFLTPDMQRQLKTILSEKYPGSFPVKSMDDALCGDGEEPIVEPKKKSAKTTKSTSKRNSVPPSGNKSIMDFMAPKKAAPKKK